MEISNAHCKKCQYTWEVISGAMIRGKRKILATKDSIECPSCNNTENLTLTFIENLGEEH